MTALIRTALVLLVLLSSSGCCTALAHQYVLWPHERERFAHPRVEADEIARVTSLAVVARKDEVKVELWYEGASGQRQIVQARAPRSSVRPAPLLVVGLREPIGVGEPAFRVGPDGVVEERRHAITADELQGCAVLEVAFDLALAGGPVWRTAPGVVHFPRGGWRADVSRARFLEQSESVELAVPLGPREVWDPPTAGRVVEVVSWHALTIPLDLATSPLQLVVFGSVWVKDLFAHVP